MTEERDPCKTSQGFIRAKCLTDEQMEAITVLMESDMAAGSACREHGTSLTQYLRRARREPAIWQRLEHRWETWRQQGVVPSDSDGGAAAGNDKAGVHEVEPPD